MKYPWFAPKMQVFESGDVQDMCGEDVSFCLDAIAAGYKIWCDPASELVTKNLALSEEVAMPRKQKNYYKCLPWRGAVHEELTEEEFMDKMEWYAHEYYMTQDPSLNPANFRHEMKQLLEE